MISSMKDIYPLIKEGIEQGQEVKINVFGHSMEPFIYNGDNVTLKKFDSYKKNDIILYQRDNKSFVLHRIYQVKGDTFVLLGDHQFKKEYGVRKDQIIAKVINFEKKGKTKYLKGFKYNMCLLFWNRILLRRVILKLRHIFLKK